MALVRKQTSFIQDLTVEKENWHIVVRVIRLWFVSDFNRPNFPFSLELVLQDELVILSTPNFDRMNKIYFKK